VQISSLVFMVFFRWVAPINIAHSHVKTMTGRGRQERELFLCGKP
jgi:hypothetical protein